MTTSPTSSPIADATERPESRRPSVGPAACTVVAMLSVGSAAATPVGAPPALPYTAIYGRDYSSSFHSLAGVAVDASRQEILVADAGRHEIAAYDTNGIHRGRFVHEVPDSTGLMVPGTPYALAVDAQGRIYVSDTRVSWVDVVNVRGKSVGRLELPAPDNDPIRSGAGALAIAPDGSIFVATRGDSGRVHVFDANFRHVSTWGTPGTEAGQLSIITGIAIAPDGRVAVCCVSTKLAVQLYDRTGSFLTGFGVHDHGAANFSLPSGVAYTAGGRLWVLDGMRQTVSVFEGTGSFVGLVGGMGSGPGQFQYPCALASDGQELLVVAERVGNRVQVLRTR